MTKLLKQGSNYVVKVGQAADYRLEILNNIFRPTTMGFLYELGLKPGMSVLEVGCGTGHVTIDIAKAVGPTGHVTAIDISPEQVAVAKTNITQAGLGNVTLKAMNANELRELGKQFHLVCSRFILMHLEDPDRALAAMWASVMAGGILACEEPEMSKCYSNTPSDAFDESMAWHMAYAAHAGLNFDIGLTLLPKFQELGFDHASEICSQPIVKGEQKEKAIYPLLHAECKEKYVEAGVAKAEEVDRAVKELETLVANSRTFFGCAMQHQVWAKKPSAPQEQPLCEGQLRAKL